MEKDTEKEMDPRLVSIISLMDAGCGVHDPISASLFVALGGGVKNYF